MLAPGDPNGLTKETPTVAQHLKQAGYSTVQFGKWHVGDRPENFLTANGFDEMYDMHVSLLPQSAQPKQPYFNDQTFGGLRVKNYKTLYTAKDTWLGQDQSLKVPAVYDLWWDPGE